MDNKNYEARYQTISDFMTKKGNDYLRIVKRTDLILQIYLGKDFKKTNEVQDIIHEILGDLVDGTRAWDMSKHSLEKIINKNLRSEIYALAKKERRYINLRDFGNEDNEDEDANTAMDKLIYTEKEDIEGKIDADAICSYCFKVILKDDEDDQVIFDEMLKGNKQRQIAKYMDKTVDYIEVRIRAIRRKIRRELPLYFFENISQNLNNKIFNNSESTAHDKKQIKHSSKPVSG